MVGKNNDSAHTCARIPTGSVGVEIGVWKGDSSARFLTRASHLHLVDSWSTVQWDFHHARPDWINKFDIVYSNSFDHSIDPSGALATWSDQLTDLGRLYVEYSFHVKSRAWDPLEIQSNELEHLFSQVGLCVLSTTPTSAATGLKSLMYQLKRT